MSRVIPYHEDRNGEPEPCNVWGEQQLESDIEHTLREDGRIKITHESVAQVISLRSLLWRPQGVTEREIQLQHKREGGHRNTGKRVSIYSPADSTKSQLTVQVLHRSSTPA